MITNENQIIPGTYGHCDSNLELRISSSTQTAKELVKILTLTNKSVAWKVNFLKKKLKYWKSITEIVIPENHPDFKKTETKIKKAKEKIPEIESEIESLSPRIKERLYTITAPGTMIIPPGLWYLCERIEDDQHLNTNIKPLCLPECRTYQREMVAAMMKYKRAMGVLATGLGKTKVIISISLSAVRSGKRVMIIVPSEYLVGQMHEEIKALHPNTTAQGGGRQAVGGWDILVSTQQSAGMYADIPHVVIIDEGHHNPAETWMDLACSLSNATHVYGVTATAFRSDGLDTAIHSFCGPVVYSRDAQWGIENKFLTPFKPYIVKIHPKIKGKKLRLSENIPATTAYKIATSSYDVLSFVKERMIKGLEKNRRIIIIFKTVQACMEFRKFCSSSINVDVASATKGAKTKAPLKRFKEKKTQVLLANSGLIAEGVDIPSADMLIQVCQNSSDVMTMQMLGRVLRLSDGKVNSIVVDVVIMGYDQFERAGERRTNIYSNIAKEENTTIINV